MSSGSGGGALQSPDPRADPSAEGEPAVVGDGCASGLPSPLRSPATTPPARTAITAATTAMTTQRCVEARIPTSP
jgi:hypothetical protein